MQRAVHRRRPRRRRAVGAAPGRGEGAGVGAAALEARAVAGGERRRLVEEEDLGVARRPRPRAGGRGTRSGRQIHARLRQRARPSVPSGRCSRPPRLPISSAARRRRRAGCRRARERFWSGEGRSMRPSERMEIAERSSPNFGPRRDGLRPELVVLHYTAMATAEAALDRLCDPAAEVSAHYLIAEDGRVWRAGRRGGARLARRRRQLGAARTTSTRARSASSSPTPARSPASRRSPSRRWRRSRRCSTASSRAGRSRRPASSPIPTWRPGRKADPGPKFDWRRLARGGRAVWAERPGGPRPAGTAFAAAAAAAGYARARRRLAGGARGRAPALPALGGGRARGRRRGGAQG